MNEENSVVVTLIGKVQVTKFFNIIEIGKKAVHERVNMPKLKVMLLTGRTLRQGQGKEYGKLSELYQKSVSNCEIDPEDLEKLGTKDGENVKVTTEYGSVILNGVKSKRAPHWGVIFVPYGPWASAIINPETHGTGMPSFKGVEAFIEPAPNDKVLQFKEIIAQEFKKE